jgi:hypothetical protein
MRSSRPYAVRAAVFLSGITCMTALTGACHGTPPGQQVDPGTTPLDPALLAAPPTGQGFQFGTDAFDVPAGTEEQDCYFYRVKDLAQAAGLDPAAPFPLHRIELVQTPGSHHMNLFRVRTLAGLNPANGAVQKATNGMGQCFVSSNWSDWPLVANTQQEGNLDWTYPDGVALTLNSGDSAQETDEWLMLQTHYVNATTQQTPTHGQVRVNYWNIDKRAVTAEMGTIFATLQSIRICKDNPTPEFGTGCQFGGTQPVTIIGANGHFHSRGTKFDIYSWDGKTPQTPPVSQRFYSSTTWADPPMMRSPQLNLQVQPGSGIYYTCDYQWQPPDPSFGGCDKLNSIDETKHMTPASAVDCCYTFGPQVDQNEHCNAFVYYYPKQKDVNCF